LPRTYPLTRQISGPVRGAAVRARRRHPAATPVLEPRGT